MHKLTTQRAGDRSHRARAPSRARARNRRALHYGEIKIAQDVINDDAMRRLLRMKGRSLHARLAAAHAVRARRHAVLLARRHRKRRARSRDAHRADHGQAEPNRKHRFAASSATPPTPKRAASSPGTTAASTTSGHRFKIELIGSSVLNELSVRYVIPVMDVALEKLEFTGTLARGRARRYAQRARRGRRGLTQALGRWQRVLFLRLLGRNDDFPRRGRPAIPTTRHFYSFPGISYSTCRATSSAARCGPITSTPSCAARRARSARSFVSAIAPAGRTHFRLRASSGTCVCAASSARARVAEFSDLPASQRFFAGGDRSVRGFGLNELSPRD